MWVSEVMLQQTQAARVAECWPRFLARFPSVRALAEAAEDDVLAAWSGLGYYRRARALLEGARAVVSEREGVLPATADELRGLPGVGEYTAAAVASIAFGEVVPVLDANAARVFGRVAARRADASTAAGRGRLLAEGAQLIDPARPGDWNQAVMELGATVCLPAPRCDECPVRRHCLGRRSGRPAAYPGSGRRVTSVGVTEASALVIRRGRVLLVRGEHPRGWWKGLWALPRSHGPAAADPAVLTAEVRRLTGVSCRFAGPPVAARYSVTRHRVTMLVFRATRVTGRIASGGSAAWFDAARLVEAGAPALPAPDRRAIAAAAGPRAASGGPARAATVRGRTRR